MRIGGDVVCVFHISPIDQERGKAEIATCAKGLNLCHIFLHQHSTSSRHIGTIGSVDIFNKVIGYDYFSGIRMLNRDIQAAN